MKKTFATELVFAALLGLLCPAGYATVFNVNSPATLVAAMNTANSSAGPHTINLAAGTYNLSGELPVIAANRVIIFQGGTANAADTVLHQTVAGTRILETFFNGSDNNIVLMFNNLTFDNGQGGDYGGGALLVGGIGSTTTANNCVFNNNSTSTGRGELDGGAIENSPNGNVTVVGCRFTGNSSAVYGGAINFLNQSGGAGSLVVSGSVFTGNSSVSDGGAINANTASGVITISDCSFENNSTTKADPIGGRGGAIAHTDGPMVAINNRFLNNTAAIHTNGDTIREGEGTGSCDAILNWWDANAGPGPNDLLASGIITFSPWLLAPVSIQRNAAESTKVTVSDLLANSTLTLVSVQSPTPGGATVVINGDWVLYSPPEGFTSPDTFTFTVIDAHGGTGIGMVTVNITTNNGPGLNLLSIQNLGGNTFDVSFNGIPGRTYTVQYTENLQTPSWQVFGAATADALGVFHVTDNTGGATRFYQVVYP